MMQMVLNRHSKLRLLTFATAFAVILESVLALALGDSWSDGNAPLTLPAKALLLPQTSVDWIALELARRVVFLISGLTFASDKKKKKTVFAHLQNDERAIFLAHL